jgi:hypothetical protein
MQQYADRIAAIAARRGSVLDVEGELRTALDEARRAEAEETAARHAAYLASFEPPSVPTDLGALHGRLTGVLDETHAKTRAHRDAEHGRIESKRRELDPAAEQARAVQEELYALQREHGALVSDLVATDWFRLRGSVDPNSLRAEWLLSQIDRIVRDVHSALFGTVTQLERVPFRIRALTPMQLLTTSEIPSPAERIAHDVRAMAGAPHTVTDGLAVLTRLLTELDRFRLSEPVPVRTIERPQHTVRPTSAVTEYNVLTGTAPNVTRR